MKDVVKMVASNPEWKKTCPRCGLDMGEYPALSRYADVDICSSCGTDEALLGFSKFITKDNAFDNWFIMQKGADFSYEN